MAKPNTSSLATVCEVPNMRLVAVSGLFDWDILIAYSFHYSDEQDVKLIVKYSM